MATKNVGAQIHQRVDVMVHDRNEPQNIGRFTLQRKASRQLCKFIDASLPLAKTVDEFEVIAFEVNRAFDLDALNLLQAEHLMDKLAQAPDEPRSPALRQAMRQATRQAPQAQLAPKRKPASSHTFLGADAPQGILAELRKHPVSQAVREANHAEASLQCASKTWRLSHD